MEVTQSKTSRTTRQQVAILEVLAHAKKFCSAQQIHNLLVKKNRDVALATVYRALKSFAESGEVDVIFSEGETLYRRCKSAEHHHHLMCRDCGASVEIEYPDLEEWASEVAASHGFESVDHTLELYGTCPKCSARSSNG